MLVKLLAFGPLFATGCEVESLPKIEFDDYWFKFPMPLFRPELFLAALKKLDVV